jgi:hypothetical protein
MTENTTTTGGNEAEAEAESGTESAEATTESAEAKTEFAAISTPSETPAQLPEELIEIDEDGNDDEDDVPGTGAVSGGFGIAGIGLALVSLTTNWTSGVVTAHAQYNQEAHASSQLTAQQTLDMYAASWHTQAWWALAFALGGLLFGAGALLSPGILLSGKTPGWAKATCTAALILGLVAAILGILTLTHVFGGNITAPAS